MPIKLAANAYGKQAINLSRIIRHADHHELRQVSVAVQLTGDFDAAHTLGDNSLILPTDTQKNTVYALAREHFTGTIEAFGLVLARHFVSRNVQVSKARIELVEHLWQRMHFDGHDHPHAFTGGDSEKRRAVVELSADGTLTVSAGIKGLLLAKTADSGFVGYPKDEYTTLPETTDRILSTECEAEWPYTSADLDFEALYQQIRTTLLRTLPGTRAYRCSTRSTPSARKSWRRPTRCGKSASLCTTSTTFHSTSRLSARRTPTRYSWRPMRHLATSRVQ